MSLYAISNTSLSIRTPLYYLVVKTVLTDCNNYSSKKIKNLSHWGFCNDDNTKSASVNTSGLFLGC